MSFHNTESKSPFHRQFMHIADSDAKDKLMEEHCWLPISTVSFFLGGPKC